MHKYVTNSDFIMQFNWHKLTMLEIVILFTWSQNALLFNWLFSPFKDKHLILNSAPPLKTSPYFKHYLLVECFSNIF